MTKCIEIEIPYGIRHLAKILHDNNFSLHIVGGYIRDSLIEDMEQELSDIDICGDCLPDEFVQITKNDKRIDIKSTNYPLGTIKLFADDVELEYTCFRTESYRGDGYHTPDEVVFTKDIYQDALRRDFTINSIYYDISNGKIYDPFDGAADIKHKVIRCSRDSIEVFTEDALRLLRMCRFASKLGFGIDRDTMNGAIATSHLINSISKERIGQELKRILMSEYIDTGAKIFFDTGLNNHIAPEVNQYDMALVKNAPKNENIRWAVFLHNLPSDKVNKYITSLSLGKLLGKKISYLVDNITIWQKSEKNIMFEFAKMEKDTAGELLEVIRLTENKHYENILTIFNEMVENSRFIEYSNIDIDGKEIMECIDIDPIEIKKYKDMIFAFIINNPDKNNKSDIKDFLLELYN